MVNQSNNNNNSNRRIEMIAHHIAPGSLSHDESINSSSSLDFLNQKKSLLSDSIDYEQQSFLYSNTTAASNKMTSIFGTIPTAPRDPILGLSEAFKEDTSPSKVNLGVGAYRTEEGKPLVLNVVKKVEQKILEQNLDKEYIPQDGLEAFKKVSPKLMFGENCKALQEGRIVCVQSISGTGALRLGIEFIAKFLPAGTALYVSNPTWINHIQICQSAGVPVGYYRYFDNKTNGLAFNDMIHDLKTIPNKSVVLLHSCAHNPTGVDPTPEQWSIIADVMQEKGHFTFFDSAYQGFASGDLDKDAAAIRMFVDRGIEMLASQSYAKNFGLYGERIGALNIVVNNVETAKQIQSQMKVIVRCLYSSPPLQGARIVAMTLSNPEYFAEWKKELIMMSDRIKEMRQLLFDALKKRNTPGNWNHILEQIGMFSFTGLQKKHVAVLIEKYHIYLTDNGRISMCGLNRKNVEYVADAIDFVVRNV
ncbi:aspartate aminotransferase [Naegleria gruberi]|uniref:Aspartate aminotransferase n=1 Tax=Naegleria gruberi TaxID=5762 RepID=D2V5T4_NAEGR|nr:aspartate aminotransferase [Naegleria gruberi]EFC47850.1 aspartate aminotransferase [Naegleria gruberi]|eukprot:XP_002680594.1 aspartate aminotransferase [Naegleria gruberi strain NEG-M]